MRPPQRVCRDDEVCSASLRAAAANDDVFIVLAVQKLQISHKHPSNSLNPPGLSSESSDRGMAGWAHQLRERAEAVCSRRRHSW